MQNKFQIPWNSTIVTVDVKGDNHDRFFILHLPDGDKRLVLDTDENGIEHWIEPGMGKTALASQLGMLIETQDLAFLNRENFGV